ncbi:MAG TPA: hypothetical protein VJZ51_05855 [Bacilli bacterium]|nr:hypothetical protein [Bacilli bacterium]
MSKELEALEKLNHTICLNSPTIKWGIDTYDHIDCKDEKEFVKCYNIIEQALKRNEPMKVANRTETEEGHYEVEEQGYISGRHYLITITSGECPVCGNPMDDRENIVSPIFCPHCGQRLDWSK